VQNFTAPTLYTELMEVLFAEQGEMKKSLKVVSLNAFLFLAGVFLREWCSYLA